MSSHTQELEERPGSVAARRQGGTGGSAHGVRAGISGLVCALMSYVVMASGLLPGGLALVPLLVLLVVVPVADSVARRVAINGAIFVGWTPLLWWVRWPVSFDHGALVVALTVGSLAALVAGSQHPRVALKRLVPSVRPVDVLIPVGGLLALVAMTNWAFAGTPKRALMVLLPGADNYPHFNMFAGIRTYGATFDALNGAPDGSRWAFFNYPQGFHALAATLSEFLAPRTSTGPELLVVYTQAVACVVVLGIVMLTAAVLSIPGLRDRAGIALPVITVTWAAYLWEPGQKAIVDGFANFWLGAAAAGTALLLSISAPRWLARADALAIGGLLVACAHTWTPLLLFALPAAASLAAGLRERKAEPENRGRLWFAVGVASATSLAVLAAIVLLLRTVPVGYVVTTQTGGLHGTSPVPMFLLLALALYCCLALPIALRRRADAGQVPLIATRIRALGLTPLLGVLVLGAFLVAQLQLIGTTAYYFLKYVIGFELVMAALAPALCGMAVAFAIPRFSRRVGVALAVVATLVATQAFGRFPQGTMPLFSETGDGTAGVGPPLSRSGIAAGILAAVRGTDPKGTLKVEYFPLGSARASNPFYADAWFHATQHSLSEAVFSRYGPWRVEVKGLDDAARLIEATLRDEPDVRVVLDPRFVQPIRERLDASGLGDRVFGWS